MTILLILLLLLYIYQILGTTAVYVHELIKDNTWYVVNQSNDNEDLPGTFQLLTYFRACAQYREQWILPGKSAATKRSKSLSIR